jgi:ankyrin repeat protein
VLYRTQVGRNNQGEPPIVLAARKGQVEAARFLLEQGADLEERDANGDSALLAAAETGQLDMAKWLIEQGADTNAKDDDKNSVLHVAAYSGTPELVKVLLEAGARPDALNDEEETPLEIAKNQDNARAIIQFCTKNVITGDNPESPFKKLPIGSICTLFWSAIGIGKDNVMFQNFGVYPFDRLMDTERIHVLTEVAEAVSGYKENIPYDILHESALYAVFAMINLRVKREIESLDSENVKDDSKIWRSLVLESYEQLFQTNPKVFGVSLKCTKGVVWSTIVDSLAGYFFGDIIWEKKKMFQCPISLERKRFLKRLQQSTNSDRYFFSHLPPSEQLLQSAVQLTFKKLITMSRNFLSEEVLETTSCFCQDCITEREIPLAFKLQVLEESAEERKKLKKVKKSKEGKSQTDDESSSERDAVHEVILKNRTELANFWSSISMEEKWALTEMSTSDLNDTVYQSVHWETLRAALDSYKKYSWDEDRLEITDEIVTICDDLTDLKTSEASLHMMIECASSASQEPVHINTGKLLNEEEWDFKSRNMLENLVLAEFALKIAMQFLIKTEESRAQRAALELELELLKEEEQKKVASKKSKKKKTKNKKKKKTNSVNKTTKEEEVDADSEDEEEESVQLNEAVVQSESKFEELGEKEEKVVENFSEEDETKEVSEDAPEVDNSRNEDYETESESSIEENDWKHSIKGVNSYVGLISFSSLLI